MKRSGMREQQLPASFPHFAALHAGYAFWEPLVVLGGIVRSRTVTAFSLNKNLEELS